MNRFDRIFATALAGAALTLCVAANSIAANAESAPSAAAVAYSYTLEECLGNGKRGPTHRSENHDVYG